jgi:hypothetical protein
MAFERPNPEDFPRLIGELQARKISLQKIGMELGGISKHTVYSWAMGAVPNHSDGEALRLLHLQVCGTATA